MIYEAYQAHADALWPLRRFGRAAAPALMDLDYGLAGHPPHRHWAAACEVFNLAEVRHHRPAWNIAEVAVTGEPVAVTEEVVQATPFATLPIQALA